MLGTKHALSSGWCSTGVCSRVSLMLQGSHSSSALPATLLETAGYQKPAAHCRLPPPVGNGRTRATRSCCTAVHPNGRRIWGIARPILQVDWGQTKYSVQWVLRNKATKLSSVPTKAGRDGLAKLLRRACLCTALPHDFFWIDGRLPPPAGGRPSRGVGLSSLQPAVKRVCAPVPVGGTQARA